MLCEKTFKSVGGKQSEKNCGDLCPQEKSELKSATKTMLSNNYISNTVRQHRSKEQTSTRQIINNHSLNMKQKSIQLVLITCFFTTLLMPNLINCQKQRPRRGPAIIPHPNLKLAPGTSSSVVSRNEEKVSSGGGSLSCEPKFLEQCIKMANPLLQEPKHVFPSTSEDVDHVCSEIFPKTWSEYITCIKSFTSSCLTSNQRSDFNRAVGDSINSVHKMCTNEDYKSDYLRNAECIKQKAIDEDICKKYYDELLEHIQTGKSTDDMCCAHDSFKMCVIEETKECPCDEDWCSDNTQTASHFAKTIMDNSLGFLLKQCNSIVSPVKTCKAYIPKRPRFEEPISSSSGSSNGDFDGGYFPSGGSTRGSNNNAGSLPPQIVINENGVISTNYDQRSPKEVSQSGLEAGFSLVSSDGNNIDPKTLQSLQEGQRIFQSGQNTESSTFQTVNQGSYGLQQHGTRNYKVNGGQQLLWPPETEITDFDEFLRNTLRAGASPQFSRGHSSASSQIHRPFYQTFSMIAKSLSLIILYRFTTLHLL